MKYEHLYLKYYLHYFKNKTMKKEYRQIVVDNFFINMNIDKAILLKIMNIDRTIFLPEIPLNPLKSSV